MKRREAGRVFWVKLPKAPCGSTQAVVVYPAMAESGKSENVPKPAATVVLAQERNGELQVYLLRRSACSGFMPGNYVFPGGVVDTEDHAPALWKAHMDMDEDAFFEKLGGDLTLEETLIYGAAAIRETFEEAGVLLGSRKPQSQHDLEMACERRMDEKLPKGWLREWVDKEGWILAVSWLAPWSHWITPEARSRRYDTRFFIAMMPAEQECIPDSRETTHGIWINPRKGLKENLNGDLFLSPPALVTLHELSQYSNMEALAKKLENRAWGEACLPILIRSQQEALILLPEDPMYNRAREIDITSQEKVPLAVGDAFSRLWYHEGSWIPLKS
jgi:8-oxo-dGTP pyrophosphatase MutT (NUDIX family)